MDKDTFFMLRISLLSIVITATCCNPMTVRAANGNLIANPGFEERDANGLPKDWYVFDEGQGKGADYRRHKIKFKSEPNIVHTGGRSGSMYHEDLSYPYWVMLRQDLKLAPGEYVFTGYVYWRGRSLARPVVAIHLIDKQGGVAHPLAYSMINKPTPDGWQKFWLKFDVGDTIETVGVNAIATDGPANVYIDDVGVYRIEDAPKQVQKQEDAPAVIPESMGHPTLTGLAPSLKARVEKIDGIWYLVGIDGKAFFDRGSTFVSYPHPGSWYNSLCPSRGQNVRKAWPDYTDWADVTLSNFKEWGFTSLGAWSDSFILKQAAEMDIYYWGILGFDRIDKAYLLTNQQGGVIPVGGTSRMADPFNPKWREDISKMAGSYINGLNSNTHTIGFFADNEISLGVVPLYAYAWTPHCRAAMARWLEKRYEGDVAKLNSAWNRNGLRTVNYSDFDDTVTHPPELIIVRENEEDPFMNDMEAFEDFIVETWVDVVIATIRKYAPEVIIASPRLPGTRFADYKPLRHFSKFDVVAVNCYGGLHYSPKDIENLKAIHRMTGRPILISEWSVTDKDHTGEGNIRTQRIRAYEEKMRQISNLPFMLGMHWHMWFPCAVEGGTYSIVDEWDKPKPFVSGIAEIHKMFDAGE